MENQEKREWLFEIIAVLFIIFGVIIFCVVYQPKKVQPYLDLVGLKKIDGNTPVEIDKAIALFSKEANKKILKGSHIIVRKTDLKISNHAIKEYIHWKIKQNFTELDDIDVCGNDNIVVKEIKDSGEIFTISARLEEFNGVSKDKLFDDEEDYNYRFFISMDKNGKAILMRNYAIMDENLGGLEFSIEVVANDSLMEQECIAELEESLRSYYSELDGCTIGGLLYAGDCKTNEKLGKQIEIMLNEKNCKSEMCDEKDKCEPCTDGECPYDCNYKSKCFSYDYHNFDACGYMSMKSNVPIKGCFAGSVWKIEFCEPDGSYPFYSVPKNIDCENITPKRVKDNTTYKSKF